MGSRSPDRWGCVWFFCAGQLPGDERRSKQFHLPRSPPNLLRVRRKRLKRIAQEFPQRGQNRRTIVPKIRKPHFYRQKLIHESAKHNSFPCGILRRWHRQSSDETAFSDEFEYFCLSCRLVGYTWADSRHRKDAIQVLAESRLDISAYGYQRNFV